MESLGCFNLLLLLVNPPTGEIATFWILGLCDCPRFTAAIGVDLDLGVVAFYDHLYFVFVHSSVLWLG